MDVTEVAKFVEWFKEERPKYEALADRNVTLMAMDFPALLWRSW